MVLCSTGFARAATLALCLGAMPAAGFADETKDPARDRIKALDGAMLEDAYADALRQMGCRVDFNDRPKMLALFELFENVVYQEAQVSQASQENNWVVGDALGRKDEAYFALEKAGLARFDEETKIMTLVEC